MSYKKTQKGISVISGIKLIKGILFQRDWSSQIKNQINSGTKELNKCDEDCIRKHQKLRPYVRENQ